MRRSGESIPDDESMLDIEKYPIGEFGGRWASVPETLVYKEGESVPQVLAGLEDLENDTPEIDEEN